MSFVLYERKYEKQIDIPGERVLFLTKNNLIHCHSSPAAATLSQH